MTLARPAFVERWERLRSTRSYGPVLILIVLSFTLAVALPDQNWSRLVLLVLSSATLTLALWTSGARESTAVAVVIAALLLVLIAAVSMVEGGNAARITLAISWAATVAATPLVIGRSLRSLEVTARTVTGALCVYLLIGMFFTGVFSTVAAIEDGPFYSSGETADTSNLVYFSYVTQTTVGYGDFTAAGDVGRSLAVVEGLLGQIYLVTVVALVVSNLGRGREGRQTGEGLL